MDTWYAAKERYHCQTRQISVKLTHNTNGPNSVELYELKAVRMANAPLCVFQHKENVRKSIKMYLFGGRVGGLKQNALD